MWEISAVLSMREEGSIWLRPEAHSSYADLIRASFADATGDHMTLLHAFRAYVGEAEKLSKLKDLSQAEYCRHLEHWCDQHAINFTAIEAANETLLGIGSILREADKSLKLGPIPSDALAARADELSAFLRKMLLQSSFLNVAVHEKDDTYRTLAENQPGLIHPRVCWLMLRGTSLSTTSLWMCR